LKPANFSVGEEVSVGGRAGRFVKILDFDRFMVRFESGETRVVTAQDIDRAPVFGASKRHYDDCSPDEIQEAYRWHDALKPVLENSLERGEREAFVSAVADKLGVGRATVYRRLEQWNGDPVSLLPGKRPGGRGQSRLGNERHALLAHIIDQEYLNRRQRNVQEVYNDFVLPAFADAKLTAPGLATVYRHVDNVDPIHAIERRLGKRAARDAKASLMGKFPFGTVKRRSKLTPDRRPILTPLRSVPGPAARRVAVS
jgi:putative transposase